MEEELAHLCNVPMMKKNKTPYVTLNADLAMIAMALFAGANVLLVNPIAPPFVFKVLINAPPKSKTSLKMSLKSQ